MPGARTSDEPVFRLATEADADQLLAFMRDYYAFDGRGFDRSGARTALIHLLREPAFGLVWLICDGKAAVGYAALCFGYSLEYLGRYAYLDEFFLLPTHRGRGWGRRALTFVEDEARKRGVRSIHLEVVRTNTGAGELYRKAGYVDHSHYLMTKWIEREFTKPSGETPRDTIQGEK
jgi:GNAT superfamily N-acetyltransferase